MPKSQRNRKLDWKKDKNKKLKKAKIVKANATLMERNGIKQAATIPIQKGKTKRTKGIECQVFIDV